MKKGETIDESQIAIEQFRIKRMIKMLMFCKGDGTSRISIICPPKKALAEISTKLAEEYGKASNIKDKRNAQSVESCINSVRERIKLYNNRTPPNGLVIFCGQI
jgi:peptide chain release factor subunit 1